MSLTLFAFIEMNGFGLIKDPRETDIKTLVLANTDKRKDKWLYLN